jgi:phosphonate transport system substrate-binding protein
MMTQAQPVSGTKSSRNSFSSTNMGRLLRLAAMAFCLALAVPAFAQNNKVEEPVRIGLTPVFLDDQMTFLNLWRDYLQKRLNRPVVFVQRGSYREVVDLLHQNRLDFAWVCGYPYVRYNRMKLLAVPIFKGKPLYQSYLIVPATDTQTRSLLDLRGKVFAYSDPDSNSGYLYPQFALHQLQEKPGAFFSKTFFTWSHRKVVEAVAISLAQGGAVDGYVWEALSKSHPELTAKTRVVQKSPEFGFLPFAARTSISRSEYEAMQAVLVGMSDDPEGKDLLRRLDLDGFAVGSPRLFDGIARMVRVINGS